MKLLLFVLAFSFQFCAFSKVAYVNFETVLDKTKEGRLLRKKFEKELASRQSQIQKTEKKIQEEKQKFESEVGILSESEKRKRAQKIQMKMIEFQRSVEGTQKELSEYQMRLFAGVVKKMRPILKKIAGDKGYTRVDKMSGDILWVSDQADITSEVVKAYNKKYK